MRGTENVTPILEPLEAGTTASPVEPAKETLPRPKKSLARRQTRRRQILLWAVTILVLWYLNTSVLRYLNQSREIYGVFWPHHWWLFVHAIGGTIALALGPVHFWPGMKEEQPVLHRVLGIAYLAGAIVSSLSAFYLAYHTGFGWMFGAGLGAMATAWILTTGMAAVALYRRVVPQHREWMVRSYVVTFGFVLMRMTTETLDIFDVGTVTDRLVFASWVSWSIPLLLTEAFLQGRRVFGSYNPQTFRDY
jgi:hypothetical protein